MIDSFAIIDSLEADPPYLHIWDGEPARWGFGRPGLELLDRLVKPGDATLETGAGYSTILFAAKGARHTSVMPDIYTKDAILKYCEARGIATDNVTFIVDGSQRVLPHLQTDPLDLVLIDGEHAFPLPYIDWYYTEPMLKLGGKVLVDDIQLRSCAILRSYLALQPQWRFEGDVADNLSVFTKLYNGSTLPGWAGQVLFNPHNEKYPSIESDKYSFAELFSVEAKKSHSELMICRQELAAIKSSRLWRATRPLVTLLDAIKRR